jgi:cysteinyl-tRNA synthetase
MAMKHLGKTFDIHGGGMDLIFPHHENEIAQSCAATGKESARYWLHNGFVQINQEKMSKSLGNFFTIREIFEKWKYPEEITAEALRGFLLATHYRSPVDFSDQALDESKKAMDGFYGLFRRLEEPADENNAGDMSLLTEIERLKKEFALAMDDDFNTSAALAAFQRLRGETNKLLETGLSRKMRQATLRAFQNHGLVLGLFQVRPKDWKFGKDVTVAVTGLEARATSGTVSVKSEPSDAEIEQLIAERSEARKKKNFARADEIRKTLAAQGIILEDRPDGTTRWKR